MPIGLGLGNEAQAAESKRSGRTRRCPAAAWCTTRDRYFAGVVLAGADLVAAAGVELVLDLW
jgi:hypothetical protein